MKFFIKIHSSKELLLLEHRHKNRQTKFLKYENRVLRRIFGPKRDEVIGEWRKLHNEELDDLYCSLLSN